MHAHRTVAERERALMGGVPLIHDFLIGMILCE